jgi:hypothetical protein
MKQKVGEERITRLGVAILRGGGVVTFPTAMTMLGETKQATSRTLDWAVKAGMLRKIPIPGGSHVWMSERALVREFDAEETPAVYKLSRQSDRWVPGPTFRHDQLALRVLFSLADPTDLLTEHEIRAAGCWKNRVPDGVIRMMLPGRQEPSVVELEVETSRKTGAAFKANGAMGGWAKLANRLFQVAHDWFGARQETVLGFTEATLIVASRSHLSSIAKKIQEFHVAEQRSGTNVDSTTWYAAELRPDGDIGPVADRVTGASERYSPSTSTPIDVEDDIWA